MNIPQEAYKNVEGVTLYRELCWALRRKYTAVPVDAVGKEGWDGTIKVRVPDTPLGVPVQLERKRAGRWSDALHFDGAKLRIGKKRYLVLKWHGEKWQFDESKLFAKIEAEMVQEKGYYDAANAVADQMEENRARIAAALIIDQRHVKMQTPLVANISTGWGYLVVGYDSGRAEPFLLKEMHLSPGRDFRLGSLNLNRILSHLRATLGT